MFSFYCNGSYSQNFLPLAWKISFKDTAVNKVIPQNIQSWHDVDLMLSWERQGYFWQDGSCCLASDFSVPAINKDSLFVLSVRLQCEVKCIFINGILIAGKLSNPGWGQITTFTLPKGCLHTGPSNRIEINATNLSYTGGISHNSCTLTPVNNSYNPTVKINIPVENHLFTKDNNLRSLSIQYKVHQEGTLNFCIKNDFHDTLFFKTVQVLPQDTSITIGLENAIAKPGFYECIASLHDLGYAGDVQWLAVSPTEIQCAPDTVKRFAGYWDKTIKELHQISPDFKIRKIDSLSVGNRDGYIIEMKSLGNITVRGYYFVPRTTGKHAALLHLPGYGWGFQYLDPFLKNKENVIELALCVRGHGISNDVFNPGFGIPGIWGYKLFSETENAYRGVYMDCYRAVEFLMNRPEVDTTRIGVAGGSQGGGLTLVTAGLCKHKISACAYFDPFPCDIRDFINIRTICKKEIQSYLDYYHNSCSFDEALHIQDLLDTRRFAKWIECPVLYVTGLFDDDCPSHVGFSAYNSIKSQKKFKIYPNDSHLGETGYNNDFIDFFKTVFNY